MSEGAREAIRVDRSPTRCPYCHQSLSLSPAEGETDWLACAQCLGRHHTSCWSEGRGCAACGASTPLTAAEAQDRGPAGGDFAIPVDPDQTGAAAAARARLEALRAFDEHTAREGWWTDAVVGPLTLGFLPLIKAEQRLADHEHDLGREPLPEGLEPEVQARLARARLTRLRSPFRAVASGVLVLAPVLAFLLVWLSYMAMGARPSYDTYRYWEYRELENTLEMLMVLCQFPFLLALAGHLHAVREAARRHELAQVLTALVARGAGRGETEKVLARSSQAWNLRRVVDSAVTLFCLVPFAGYFMLPFLAVRVNGALALHQQHERSLDEDVPPPATRGKPGGA